MEYYSIHPDLIHGVQKLGFLGLLESFVMIQDVPVLVSPVAHPPQNGPIADRHYQQLLEKGLDPGQAAATLVMHMAEWPRDAETWEPIQPQKDG